MSTYLGAFCTNAKYSFICSPGISLLKPKQDMCVCVRVCIWQTHLFMINCLKPSSHTAMDVLQDLLQIIHPLNSQQ